MKFKYKKYIYLVNDLTNMLLSKEKNDFLAKLKKYQVFCLALLTLFLISVIFNLYFLFK